ERPSPPMNDPASRSTFLFLLGASHHTAPLALREKLALTSDKIGLFRDRISHIPGLQEIAILNTCNRVEFYGVAESPASVERLQNEFCALQGFPREDFAAIRQ